MSLYPIFLKLEGHNVLIVGGGPIAGLVPADRGDCGGGEDAPAARGPALIEEEA